MKNFDKEQFNKKLKTQFIGKNLIHFERLNSTNDFACEIEKKSDSNNLKEDLNGAVIISEIQDQGHGRFNRNWLSPQGGLWFTIILITKIKEKDLTKMNLLAAISVAEILITKYRLKVTVKWPNDIYCNGCKLAGILSETEKINSLLYLNIGIGINVNIDSSVFANLNLKAISIMDLLGRKLKREILLAEILLSFEKNYNYFAETGDFKSIFNKMKDRIIY
ncbi:MAG: biotin--[acetyl-CoA-carboxylase] ligase [Actinobacteria bacterium]|nr:biotin--[acetyl-CoA-carboxylase] ligase [Actinomycetota bacterium]MCG2789855.1 biotin--[acetyl-CoA-carboxylase] ligase [Actinomycetes bacterium]